VSRPELQEPPELDSGGSKVLAPMATGAGGVMPRTPGRYRTLRTDPQAEAQVGEAYTAALRYANGRLPVLPLHTANSGVCTCGNPTCTSPGKHPRTRNGLHDATLEAEQVTEWWGRWPDANVGVAIPEGLLVLDLDPRNFQGDGIIGFLDNVGGKIPPTVHALTGGGGDHYWFAGNSRSRKLAPGIDIKGAGGYVVMPPSAHASGGRYAWEPGHEPGKIALAQAPDWLSDAIEGPGGSRGPTPSGEWAELLRGVGQGERNDTAARLAGRYLRLGCGASEVLELLLGWDMRNQPAMGDRKSVV